jgi:glycerol-3-phosphate dehydrogenase
MIRDLARLSRGQYDLVVVGGGIYGACVAWDASLRGLSVALVEQGDFGHATSANSQKIIHGGLRYLQTLDLARMRESIRERRTLLRLAPHLVRSLPFLLPTRRWGRYSKPVMAAALALNDLLGWDRNQGIADPQRRIPPARFLSREECLRWVPNLPADGLTGGAMWHDGQMEDSERLTLAFVHSAAEAGAAVANYIRVTGLLQRRDRVEGVRAEDVLTGRTFEIAAGCALDTCGPWVGRLLPSLNGRWQARPLRFLKAINLVTRRLITQRVALGVESPGPRSLTPGLIFITPWQDHSIVGTAYLPHEGPPERCEVREEEIEAFIGDVNLAYPAARLTRRDVSFVHVGLLPAAAHHPTGLATQSRLVDHRRLRGIEGLVSVVGVKYTTARGVAERAVNLVCAKLHRRASAEPERVGPLKGGALDRVDALLTGALWERPWGLPAPVLRQLVHRYGSCYTDVLKLVRENLTWAEPVDKTAPVMKAQVIYAIREEMAQTLGDIVLRRTGLGAASHPGEAVLRACAELMAQELGWQPARIECEVEEVNTVLARHGARSDEPAEALA